GRLRVELFRCGLAWGPAAAAGPATASWAGRRGLPGRCPARAAALAGTPGAGLGHAAAELCPLLRRLRVRPTRVRVDAVRRLRVGNRAGPVGLRRVWVRPVVDRLNEQGTVSGVLLRFGLH